VVHHSDEVLHGMNAWCVEQHGKSGLTQRVRASDVSLGAAEEAVLAFLERHTPAGCAQLAGNSVHCDLAFLKVRSWMRMLLACLCVRDSF
jgi:oligoribonuclease